MSNFAAQLEQGQEFEDVSFSEIVNNLFPDYWVISTRFSNNHKLSNRGPRAFSKNQPELVLPDFLIKPNDGTDIFWIDAKHKNKTFSYHNSPLSTTIDPRAFRNYKALKDSWGHDIFILLGDGSTNKMYLFSFENVDEWRTFNNKHDNFGKDGQTPVYHIHNTKFIGNF